MSDFAKLDMHKFVILLLGLSRVCMQVECVLCSHHCSTGSSLTLAGHKVAADSLLLASQTELKI